MLLPTSYIKGAAGVALSSSVQIITQLNRFLTVPKRNNVVENVFDLWNTVPVHPEWFLYADRSYYDRRYYHGVPG